MSGDLLEAAALGNLPEVQRLLPLAAPDDVRMAEYLARRNKQRNVQNYLKSLEEASICDAPVHIENKRLRTAANPSAPMYRLRFQLQYEPHLAGGKAHEYAAEYQPYLHVHLTHGLSRLDDDVSEGVLVVSPSMIQAQADGTHAVAVDLPFVPTRALQRQLAGDQKRLGSLPNTGIKSSMWTGTQSILKKTQLPASASIAVHAYAETATEDGKTCRTHAGTAYFLLSEVLSKDEQRADWQFTGKQPLVKGLTTISGARLHFSASGSALGAQPVSTRNAFDFAAPAVTSFMHIDDAGVNSVLTKTRNDMQAQIQDGLSLFVGDNPVVRRSDPSCLQGAFCPFFQTEVGLLSGSSFALLKARTSPAADYWETVCNIALARAGLSAERVLAGVAGQKSELAGDNSRAVLVPAYTAALKVMTSMFAVLPNNYVYEDDFVNANGETLMPKPSSTETDGTVQLVRPQGALAKAIPVQVTEEFQVPDVDGGGDCEDLAQAIHSQYYEFAEANLESVPRTATQQLLLEFQAIVQSNVYTPVLVLAAVTNKKQEVSVKEWDSSQPMWHTYAAFVPTSLFLNALSDGTTEGPHAGLRQRVLSSAYAKHYLSGAHEVHKELPVLIGEGTARSDPLPLPIASYYSPDQRAAAKERYSRVQAVQAKLMAATQGLPVNYTIPNYNLDDPDGAIARNDKDLSPFYKANSALYCSAFRDAGVLDFAFVQDQAATPVLSSDASHGLYFNQFAQPNWPASTRLVPYNPLSDEAAAITDDALAQLEPVPTAKRTAAAVATTSVPPELRPINATFGQRVTVETLTDTQSERDMPLPTSIITLSIRGEDATPDVLTKVTAAVTSVKDDCSAATVRTHYLADPPVPGDQTAVPPSVTHDIYVQVAL